MATDGVILWRDRIFAAKTETTTGTAQSLAGADAVFNAFVPDIKAEIPPVDRLGQGSLTRLAPIPGARGGKFTLRTEVYNAASMPASFGTLLLACGFQVSTGVYTPLTAGQSTVTIGMQQGPTTSRQKELAGAMGNVKISGEYGKPAYFDWEYTGKWVAPSGQTKLAPAYPVTNPPRVASAAFTIGGTTYRLGKFEINMQNKVVLRQDVTDVTGYRAAFITDRNPMLRVPIESLPLASHDFFADHLAMTTAAVSIVIGSGVNGTVTIAASAAQLYNPPQDEDRDGINLDALEFVLTSTTADGELSITLS
jgi:hypothetical protein